MSKKTEEGEKKASKGRHFKTQKKATGAPSQGLQGTMKPVAGSQWTHQPVGHTVIQEGDKKGTVGEAARRATVLAKAKALGLVKGTRKGPVLAKPMYLHRRRREMTGKVKEIKNQGPAAAVAATRRSPAVATTPDAQPDTEAVVPPTGPGPPM
jgi:hypothetical protein